MTTTAKSVPTLYEAAVLAEIKRHSEALQRLIDLKDLLQRLQPYVAGLGEAGLTLYPFSYLAVVFTEDEKTLFIEPENFRHTAELIQALQGLGFKAEGDVGPSGRQRMRAPCGLCVAVRSVATGAAA